MPEKTKTYERVIFTPEAIKQAEHALVATLSKKDRKQTGQSLDIQLSPEEKWEHDNEDEFFADYIKGFEEAIYTKYYNWGVGSIRFDVYRDVTNVSISIPRRSDLERVFNVVESFVDRCRLPREPRRDSKIKTDWISETIKKVNSYHPLTGRKLKLALNKLESEEAEEWQDAARLITDAWIELTKHLCFVGQVDTSDIDADAVVDRLKKLKIDETDEKLFNLARGCFNLSRKYHDRKISHYDAIACVISTIMSMQTVIQEVFHASS